jgi:hypothetical protein
MFTSSYTEHSRIWKELTWNFLKLDYRETPSKVYQMTARMSHKFREHKNQHVISKPVDYFSQARNSALKFVISPRTNQVTQSQQARKAITSNYTS